MIDLIKAYDNKYVRSLIQFIPFGVGSAVDIFVKEKIEEYRKERLSTFFNELENGNIELTEKIINSEDFLHNYFSTIRIVLNTRRREKIALIGRLFNSAIKEQIISLPDKYEFYLTILDELSYDEFLILELLYDFERKDSKPTNRSWRMSSNNNIWTEFKKLLEIRFNIDKNSIDETLIRIERTGCLYIPRIMPNYAIQYAALTTDIYAQLRNLIIEKNNC